MKVEWFRMPSDAVDDATLRLLEYEDRWHFVAIMCCMGQGVLDSTPDLMRRKVAAKLGMSESELDGVVMRLSEVGLIDRATLKPIEFDFQGYGLRPPANIWREIRSAIFKRDDYKCTYCGERGGKLECDHVIPVSRGGGHDESNLVTSCISCNRSKRDKLPSEWSRIVSENRNGVAINGE